MISKPVYWLPGRTPDQPFVANHPTYGKVYRIAGPDEMMEMVRRENLLIVPATELAPLGRKRLEIPFDTTGKKWVRFAAWDTAGNGAMVQPVRLTTAATATK